MIQLGDMRIHLINDGDHLVDPGGAFGLVPRVLWSRYLTPTPENLVSMKLHCLLVQVGGKNIVVDTGYGPQPDAKLVRNLQLQRPQGSLLDALARLNVSPDQVDLVIDTHLHADHASGNIYHDADGQVQPLFPNAEYVTQRREYEDAIRPNERTRATYHLENYVPLYERGQLRLLDGDTELLPGVRGVVTPGHTPGHMSVILEGAGAPVMFVCDMAGYAVHFECLGWMTAYDVEPLVTLESKRRWQQWALETNATLIFPHEPVRPVGKLVQDAEGRLTLHALNEAYA
jgi:glyoxylase-like metal-dependent hydrolase (beta-lactamase superfamily II)